MACYYHSDRDEVATCVNCGVHLCDECAHLITPPTCAACTEKYAAEVKAEFIKTTALGVLFIIAGMAFSFREYHGSAVGVFGIIFFGIWFAGIPFGWRVLNRITPSIFLALPLIGWLIYFIIKVAASFFIGLVALPVYVVRQIRKIKSVKAAQQLTEQWKSRV